MKHLGQPLSQHVLDLLLLIAIGAAACGDGTSPVGKWMGYEADDGNVPLSIVEDSRIEFFDDGTWAQGRVGGTWSLLDDGRVKAMGQASGRTAVFFLLMDGNRGVFLVGDKELPVFREGTAEEERIRRLAEANALNDKAVALRKAGKKREAVERSTEAAELGSCYAASNLAWYFAAGEGGLKQDYNQAERWYKEAIRGGCGWARRKLADYFAARGMYEKAIGHYEAHLRSRPDDADAKNSLAWLLSTCSEKAALDGPRAVQLATEATQEAGEWYTFGTLAAAHARQGDYEAALRNLEEMRGMVSGFKVLSPMSGISPEDAKRGRERYKTQSAVYAQEKPYTSDVCSRLD